MTEDLSQVAEASARSGFFMFSGTALSSVIMAVSVILLGRLLGPKLYGQYSLVMVIPTLLLLFTDLGMTTGVTKFVASLLAEKKTMHAVTIISHGLLFRLIIGFAVLALSILFSNYLALLINRPDLTFYVQLVVVSIMFQVIYSTVNAAFVGLDRSEYFALTSNVQSIMRTILQVGLVLLGFSVTGALIGYVGGFVVASIFGFVLLFSKFLKSNNFFKVRHAEKSYSNSLSLLARYGMPLYVSVVLVGFFPLYQQIVLAFFASDTAIGNFKVAYNFAMLITMILVSISTALLPAFSKLEASPELVSVFFKRANKYVSLIIVPITTVAVIFSEPIVRFLYGPVYSSAPLFLSLNCLLFFLVGIGYLTLNSVFNGLGKTRLTMNITLINFVILAVLSPVLAYEYNVVGVIVAYLIAGTTASSYAAFIAVKHLKISFDIKSLSSIYIISIVSSFPSLGLLLFTSLNSSIVLVFGVIIYFALFVTLIPLLRVIKAVELQELVGVTRRIPLLKFIALPIFRYQRKLLFIDNTTK